MTDIVQLLRSQSYFLTREDRRRIADELEHVRGENERLRADKLRTAQAKPSRFISGEVDPSYPGGAVQKGRED